MNGIVQIIDPLPEAYPVNELLITDDLFEQSS
jgi:hypothetical protein